MRTINVPQLPPASTFAVRARVFVKNSGGTFVDLTTLAGRDWVQTVSWSEEVDATTLTAEVTLGRNLHKLSLSPLMSGSGLNRGMNPNNPFAPLLQPTREVKIEVAIIPKGAEPVAADWIFVFHGHIDNVDWASDSVSLSCSDRSAVLRDAIIETERVYAHTSNAYLNGLRLWAPLTTFAVNQLMLPDPNRTGFFYKVISITSGVTADIPSNWPTTVGQQITNGGVTFQCTAATTENGMGMEFTLQSLLNDHAHQPTTLFTPTATPTLLTKYLAKRGPLFSELVKIPAQIGWMLRYKWRAQTSQFELTLFEPNRAKTISDYTFGPDDVIEVNAASQSIENVRNVCSVIYMDKTKQTTDGRPTKRTVTVKNDGSIANFGRRYMELQEDETSAIDTPTEATRLATAAVGDLATPLLDHTVRVRLFPWAELGDLYTFSANGLHYDSDQKLAVISIRHTVGPTGAFTEFGVRGKPAGAYQSWIRRAAGYLPDGVLQPFGGALSITIGPRPRGGLVKLTNSSHPVRFIPDGYEIHVSGNQEDFIPQPSTFVTRTKSLEVILENLVPGIPYWVRAIPYRIDAQGNEIRGAPSPSAAFTAGFVEEADIAVGVIPSPGFPPNGDFEDPPGNVSLPTNWVMTGSGVYGTHFLADVDVSAAGNKSLKFLASSGFGGIATDWFPLQPGLRYRAKVAMMAEVGSTQVINFLFQLADRNLAGVAGSASDTVAMNELKTDRWTEKSLVVDAPLNAAFGRIAFDRESTTPDYAGWIDNVRVEEDTRRLEVGTNWAPFNNDLAILRDAVAGPDGWKFTPAWNFGTSGIFPETTNTESGVRSVVMSGTTTIATQHAESPLVPVRENQLIRFQLRYKSSLAQVNGVSYVFAYYSASGAFISQSSGFSFTPPDTNFNTNFTVSTLVPAGVKYVALRVGKGSSASYSLYLQWVKFHESPGTTLFNWVSGDAAGTAWQIPVATATDFLGAVTVARFFHDLTGITQVRLFKATTGTLSSGVGMTMKLWSATTGNIAVDAAGVVSASWTERASINLTTSVTRENSGWLPLLNLPAGGSLADLSWRITFGCTTAPSVVPNWHIVKIEGR